MPRYKLTQCPENRYDKLARRFAEEKEESLHFLKSGIDTRKDSDQLRKYLGKYGLSWDAVRAGAAKS